MSLHTSSGDSFPAWLLKQAHLRVRESAELHSDQLFQMHSVMICRQQGQLTPKVSQVILALVILRLEP